MTKTQLLKQIKEETRIRKLQELYAMYKHVPELRDAMAERAHEILY